MFAYLSDRPSTSVSCIVIITLSIASCCGSLFGEFVFDDAEAILNNKDVLNEAPISNLLFNDFWGTRLTHNLSHKSYRPLTVLTFRLNYLFFGRLVAWSFHLCNILLHCFVSLTVWYVYHKIVGPKKVVTSLWGACLFAVHPIHTEAVSGIVGRADVLAALFYFLSFLSYTRCLDNLQKSWGWLVVTVLLAAAAMFSKEHGLTILGFNLVYELLVVKKLDQIILRRGISALTLDFPGTVRSLVLVVSAVALIWLRCFLMDFRSPTFQKGDNPGSFAEDWQTRAFTLHYLLSLNVWLLLCPDWLSFDWSMGCIQLIRHIADLRVLLTFAFWLVFVAIIMSALLSTKAATRRETLLCLALTIVPFIPASNLLFRVGFVIAERVLYIPSAGFCLLIALGIERLTSYTRKDFTFAYSLLIMIFLLKSHLRSLEWRSEASLFNSALRVCPLNAKVRYNVAKSAADRGLEERAISEYREAIRLFPEYDQAMNNLANLLKNQGELTEAENLLRKALKIRSDFPAAWMNLGIVLASRRLFTEAEKCYYNALKLRKVYPDCYYNLGNLYLEQNRHEEAKEAWLNATRLKPHMTLAWNNLIMMHDNIGNHSEAVAIAETALTAVGDVASFHFNMGNALGKMSEFSGAEEHFQKAIELEHNNPLYHVNLGVLYHRWKKYSLAEKAYITALRINPKFNSAKHNYKMLKKQLNKMGIKS